jgi:hypothetical protein
VLKCCEAIKRRCKKLKGYFKDTLSNKKGKKSYSEKKEVKKKLDENALRKSKLNKSGRIFIYNKWSSTNSNSCQDSVSGFCIVYF